MAKVVPYRLNGKDARNTTAASAPSDFMNNISIPNSTLIIMKIAKDSNSEKRGPTAKITMATMLRLIPPIKAANELSKDSPKIGATMANVMDNPIPVSNTLTEVIFRSTPRAEVGGADSERNQFSCDSCVSARMSLFFRLILRAMPPPMRITYIPNRSDTKNAGPIPIVFAICGKLISTPISALTAMNITKNSSKVYLGPMPKTAAAMALRSMPPIRSTTILMSERPT